MRNVFYMIMASLLLISSCAKEKEVTVKHPMSVEFGQDAQPGGNFSVEYHDFRGTSRTDAEISEAVDTSDAGLVLVACDRDVPSCGDMNRTSYRVGGLMGCSSLDDAYFEKKSLPSGNSLLVAEVCGYSFVIGDIAEEDGREVIEYTIQNGRAGSWIMILSKKSGLLADYSFTDCLAAQSGAPDPEDMVRDCYVYASQGVWSRMSFIEESPLRFTVNIEQE